MNLLEKKGMEAPRPQERPAVVVEKRDLEPNRETERAGMAEKKAAAQVETAPAPAPAAAASAAPPPAAKDAYHIRVERILEDNLLDVYLAMPPAVRIRFKSEGEATALKLRAMIERAKIKAKDVLLLVLKWLKMIPHVNRYFLEQEAKIKTDKIMLLAKERQQERASELA